MLYEVITYADSKNPFAHAIPFHEKGEHGQRAHDKGTDTEDLHVADDCQSFSEGTHLPSDHFMQVHVTFQSQGPDYYSQQDTTIDV